jgi:hypothetical protein
MNVLQSEGSVGANSQVVERRNDWHSNRTRRTRRRATSEDGPRKENKPVDARAEEIGGVEEGAPTERT